MKRTPAPPPSAPKPQGLRIALVVAAIALSVLLFVLARPGKPAPLPEEVLGEWRTDAPKYKDQFFVLHKDAILLGFNKRTDEWASQPILGVKERKEKEGVVYEVTYRDDNGEEQVWEFRLDADAPATICFPSQPNIKWKRARTLANLQ